MSGFKKYATPPPVGDSLRNAAAAVEQGLSGGGMPSQDYYDPMMGDPFMGGSLPPPDYYGVPKQQWNAEMMDRLIDTKIKPEKDENGVDIPKPKLWLFETDCFRHFQLSNLRSRDQTEIERSISDILMLSHQDGNEDLCEEMQVRVYSQIAMFKSRSDLPIQHRERDAWFTSVSEMKASEIKRPQGSGGGFFADLIGGKRKRSDY